VSGHIAPLKTRRALYRHLRRCVNTRTAQAFS
jgi:hypothetical protein